MPYGDDPVYDPIPLDVIETTLSKYSPTVYDNVTSHNALLHNLKEGGHIKTVKGGRSIIEEISFSNNHFAKFMSIRDKIPDDIVNIFTHAEYYFRFAQIPVGIWLDEETYNRGEAKLYDIMEERTKNGMIEFEKMFAAALYNDAPLSYTIDGIPMLIADDPTTGIIGGIDRSKTGGGPTENPDPDNRWWRNQTLNLTEYYGLLNGAAPSGDQLEEGMNILWQMCEIFNDHPTNIYCSTDMFNIYRRWLIDKRMDVSKGNGVGDLEFATLEFRGTKIYRDPYCPKAHMYFLNEEYIKLQAEEGFNFKFQKAREPYDYYKKIVPLVFLGNFTMSNAKKQGVLFYSPSTTTVSAK